MPDVFTLANVNWPRPSQGLDHGPFKALLFEDNSERASALSTLLSSLQQPNVRVVRMGSSVRSRLTLEHILLHVTELPGNLSLTDNARRIARTIAEQRDQETSVVLLITQAETLHSKTLRLLQDMAPYFVADAAPTLQVVFVGRPAFQYLLQGQDMTPLREALGFPAYTKPLEPLVDDDPSTAEAAVDVPEPPTVAPLAPPVQQTKGGPVPRPMSLVRRNGRIVRLALLLAIIAVGIGASYLAVQGLFYKDAPAPRHLSAVSPTEMQPASGTQLPVTTTLPTPMPDTLRPALAPVISAPALASRPATLQQRSFNESVSADPAVMPNPRVVIHTPAGSEASAALSAHLLASLGPHPGTVELRRVPETPNRPSVRYFHPEDEPLARQVAARMTDTGLPWTLRDFSTFLPRPSRGTIEIWLPRL